MLRHRKNQFCEFVLNSHTVGKNYTFEFHSHRRLSASRYHDRQAGPLGNSCSSRDSGFMVML